MLKANRQLSETDAALYCRMRLPEFRAHVQSEKLPRPTHNRMWSTDDLDAALAKRERRDVD
jgi:hypothetical protein